MDYRIAIPSIKRATTIKEKTINYLAKTDIDFSKVDLFLSDGEELPEYKKSLADYPINFIVTNQKHVNTQRNFIVNYYKENQLVLGIDDDIKNIEMKIDDKKTTTLLKLNEFINNAFEICLSKKVDMWGVNPVLNPFFLKNTVSFNLKYIVACFYGWRNTYQKKAYVSTNPEYGKEDYERSIRYYVADGGVGRFNYVAPNTKYYSEDGGIQTYRTVEYEEKAVEWLLNTFPHFCKRNTSKKGKFPEVRLRDSRIKKSL
jgi:hypothetical protein